MRPFRITGGILVDGSGAPALPADVGVDSGRITAVAPPGTLPAARFPDEVRARGRVVAPGFIDLHSHGDLVHALEDRRLRRKLVAGRVAQGITTEVVGNCGLGPAPLSRRHEAELRGVLGWMTPREGAWPWEGIGAYLEHLEGLGHPVNLATLAAHGAVRVAEAGLARELPDSASTGRMARAVERALDEGAFGLSVGLIYPPGSFTPTEELIPLAEVLGGRRAILAAHVRGSSETLIPAVREILEIGRRTGARIHHSHSEAVGPDHWRKIPAVLRMEREARESGLHASWDMFPYTAAATTMAAIYPPWSLEGGVGALVERLADPAGRRRIRADVERVRPQWPPWTENGWSHNLVAAVGWGRITVGSVGSQASRWAVGLSLEALGRRAGRHPFEAVSDLMVREGGVVSQIIHGISGEEGEERWMAMLAGNPEGAFCTDANDTGRGLPHPAAYGAFPRVLGTCVREKGWLTLEEAVRRMSSLPARILGLRDRGMVRERMAADLVIFDPAAVGSRATWSEPRRPAEGIAAVFVNGREVCRDGRLLGAEPGTIIRAG